MKILVVLRLAPDGEIEIAGDGRSIDREWIDMRLNDFDDHALEQAILLKEASGATVLAIAPVADGIQRTLQAAVARGADEVAVLEHDFGEEPCSRDLCKPIAALARREKTDLILTGVQCPNDLFGQLAPYLGGLLGWPCVSSVSGARYAAGAIEIMQEQGNGYSVNLSVALPAVLGIQAAAQAPRYVSGSKLRQASGFTIGTIPPAGETFANLSELVALKQPDDTGSAVMFDGDPDEVAGHVFDILKLHGLLGGSRA
ncbi:electron transfer flavoprotein subunit beta/FixA family protein [soil metagenome]